MLNVDHQLNILVTGGCGFMASNFLKSYVDKYPQHNWINIDILNYAADITRTHAFSNASNYIFKQGDICDYHFMDSQFAQYQFDIIINFCAQTHVDNANLAGAKFAYTNTYGVQVLLDLAVKYRLKLFHQVSTDEVYGQVFAGEAKCLESTAFCPSNSYAASKASAELLVIAMSKVHGLKYTISRSSNNFGINQHNEKLIPKVINSALNNERVQVYGDGLNYRNWLFVDDHSRAIEKIINSEKYNQVYNISAENEWSNIELVKVLLALVNKNESLIEFVKDRPAHDFRYAIDSQKIRTNLKWQPLVNRQNFVTTLSQIVDFEVERWKSNL